MADSSAAGTPVIRTPDQRLRVFVSSTLAELAEERAVVRAAVEQLHLIPVMFELGARPHPPRNLYRCVPGRRVCAPRVPARHPGWPRAEVEPG